MALLRSFSTPSAIVNTIVMAIFEAAPRLMQDFADVKRLTLSEKGPRDFVSVADRRCEKNLYRFLKRAYPTYGFLMEEGGEHPGEDPFQWIIDPLDGTTNFLHEIPHFAITVALWDKRADEITAAVTYNPVSDELFWAAKGTGFYCHQRRLRVSKRINLMETLLAVGLLKLDTEWGEMLLKIRPKIGAIRNSGSAALDMAYVAAGRLDGCIYADLKPWDMAAGLLFLQEAGGFFHTKNYGKTITECFKGHSLFAAADPLYNTLKADLSFS